MTAYHRSLATHMRNAEPGRFGDDRLDRIAACQIGRATLELAGGLSLIAGLAFTLWLIFVALP